MLAEGCLIALAVPAVRPNASGAAADAEGVGEGVGGGGSRGGGGGIATSPGAGSGPPLPLPLPVTWPVTWPVLSPACCCWCCCWGVGFGGKFSGDGFDFSTLEGSCLGASGEAPLTPERTKKVISLRSFALGVRSSHNTSVSPHW